MQLRAPCKYFVKLKRNAAFFRHLEAIAGNVFEIPSFIETVFSFCVLLPLCSVRSYWSLRHGVWVNDWYATRMYINMGKQCALHWNHVISTWVDISTTDVISTWEVPVPYRVSYQGVEFGRGTNSGKVASKQWSFLRRNCGSLGLDLEEDLSVTVWQPLLSSFSLLFNSWNVVNVESLSFPLYRVNIVCCSFSVVRVFHVLLLFLWLKSFFCCLFRWCWFDQLTTMHITTLTTLSPAFFSFSSGLNITMHFYT